MTIVNSRDYNQLSHTEFKDLDEKHGSNALFFHRADLHNALKALALEPASMDDLKESITLDLGSNVNDIDCEQGTLKLDSGVSITKDLLVIADGAHV